MKRGFRLMGLSSQLCQLTTVGRQPPFIEVSHAKRQSLLRRPHVPGRKGRRRQAERQGTGSNVYVRCDLGHRDHHIEARGSLSRSSNLMPPRPGNEANSPVARHKAASCGGDGEGSALPEGMPPQRTAQARRAPAPGTQRARRTDEPIPAVLPGSRGAAPG